MPDFLTWLMEQPRTPDFPLKLPHFVSTEMLADPTNTSLWPAAEQKALHAALAALPSNEHNRAAVTPQDAEFWGADDA